MSAADCPLFVGCLHIFSEIRSEMGERVAACDVYSAIDAVHVCLRNCMIFSEPGGFLCQQESQSCSPPPLREACQLADCH